MEPFMGQLACAVAVLGDGTPTAVAARLAGIGVDEAERAADALAAGGLFACDRPLRFADPRARVALYACLPPGLRAIVHRRAVRVLGEAGAGPMVLANHACAVEPAGDPCVAAALIAAGRGALTAGAPRLAALLLERGLAEPPPAAERSVARLLLARALTLLGDRRAPALTYEALAGAAPDDRPMITAELVDALWLTGGADAAQSLVSDAPGVVAAVAARDGSRPAGAIVSLAERGAVAETAFERCCAIAALIACDALDDAQRALETSARDATRRGAGAELAMLQVLRTRLRAVSGAVLDATRPLPGPDPGPAPWQAWPAGAECFGTPTSRAAALLARADDVGRLERAVALLRDSPRPALLAQALLRLGRALRHAGRRCDARAALTEALALAQRLAAGDLAEHARDELRIAGARPRREMLSGPDSLTAAERRVADAAVAGWSNREIAERLFLSTKTIEMHLGRVYRKLDISARGELSLALAA